MVAERWDRFYGADDELDTPQLLNAEEGEIGTWGPAISIATLCLAAIFLFSALFLNGCAAVYTFEQGDTAGVYLGSIPPSSNVATIDMTVVGIDLDAARNSVTVGYKRGRVTSIPAAEPPLSFPTLNSSTTIKTGLGIGATIEDSLEVNK